MKLLRKVRYSLLAVLVLLVVACTAVDANYFPNNPFTYDNVARLTLGSGTHGQIRHTLSLNNYRVTYQYNRYSSALWLRIQAELLEGT